ncbi:PQQ-dependent sugar dehydrogenase [Salisaeta longa]|uniref:PQQ-dependent sugar dehydrogenase n=1 Tax=Salisaeta longa TaxID=503170 RepID=UPI0003B35029|nr:PQQ-dependent sugar dehydrogenase [Salisaeta longa]
MRYAGSLCFALVLVLLSTGCASESGAPSSQATADPVAAPSDPEVVLARVTSEEETFRVVRVLEGLVHPWAIDWLPDGRMLITERTGRLQLVTNGTLQSVANVPDVWDENQGGLLDIAVGPNYATDGWMYMTYSAREGDVGGTVLARAKLDGARLTNREVLYKQTPFLAPDYHFGSRIVFPGDGTLLVTLGERGQRREETVEIPGNHHSIGTTVRLNLDGSVPQDNPFVGQPNARPEVYTYGHRNQQGMAIHPETGDVWQHEHGPYGGDELNLIEPGNNYGWPKVSYGETYTSPHRPIGQTEAPGVVQPVVFWDPSIAPSGMAFYTGDKFPNWKNQIFLGALARQQVRRIVLDSTEVAHQERLLFAELGRIRDVATGPDGYLYLLEDAENGALYRLEPVQ